MARRTPALSASVAALAAALVAGLGVSAPASQAAPAEEPVDYVAMGDSYSAATGVLPVAPLAPPQCLRSLRNYPHVIARRTGASLTDVTCGGAETKDFRERQYDDVPPQLDALSAETDLVTMTIGGNDGGVFSGTIQKCAQEGASTAGRGSPCEDEYGSSFTDTIREDTYPALVEALEDVQAAAPNAEVAILGYPWIMPKREGCYPKMPVARGDVPYLRTIQRVLNRTVRRAADETGATYVGLNRVSDGHDACKPIGTRWIEPVVGGTNPVIVHPNALGERKMARRTLQVLARR